MISDIGNTLSDAASSVYNTLGSKETWDTVSQAFEGDTNCFTIYGDLTQFPFLCFALSTPHPNPVFEDAGESAGAWANEAWASSSEGIQCLKVHTAPKFNPELPKSS